jgi:hypothetical protein
LDQTPDAKDLNERLDDAVRDPPGAVVVCPAYERRDNQIDLVDSVDEWAELDQPDDVIDLRPIHNMVRRS